MSTDDRQAALDALFWRDEILQVLFWMQGEGLVQAASAEDLLPFLQGERDTIARYLEKFADEGYLIRETGGNERSEMRYALSNRGEEEGARRFSEAFSGMQKQGHGACSSDCDCDWEVGHDPSCPSHSHHHSH